MNFSLNDTEKISLEAWEDEHWTACTGKKYKHQARLRLSYEFTPTGLGTRVRVKCEACGEIKDISDYGCW